MASVSIADCLNGGVHPIRLSYTWVQQALQGAGLVAKQRQRGKHRQRRDRKPMAGMLLHIDGSKHRWLGDQRWHDLIVILDDATSEIYYAQLVEEESTRTVMAGLREVIENQGLFCALYSDRGSHFFITPKAGEKVDKHRLTQVGRAMKELGVQMIPAYSPQARGRSERSFGTWQGRLPQELRLAGIDTLEGANAFLRDSYLPKFNEKFTVVAKEKGTAFRKTARADLNWIFTVQSVRVVAKQYSDDGREGVADRQDGVSEYFGWLYGNDPRALRSHGFDPLRAPRGGTLRCPGPTDPCGGEKAGGMSGAWNQPAAARNWNRPLSRFPLRGQAGGTPLGTPPLAALGRVKAPAKSKAACGGLGR